MTDAEKQDQAAAMANAACRLAIETDRTVWLAFNPDGTYTVAKDADMLVQLNNMAKRLKEEGQGRYD